MTLYVNRTTMYHIRIEFEILKFRPKYSNFYIFLSLWIMFSNSEHNLFIIQFFLSFMLSQRNELNNNRVQMYIATLCKSGTCVDYKMAARQELKGRIEGDM